MVSTSSPVLAADLNAGLKRLKMAAMRWLAPELLVTAKTQRWSPEEFLRTLVEAEIAARLQRRHATTPGRIPRDQNLGRLRPDRLLRAAGSVPLIDPAPAYRRIHGGLAGPRLSGTHRSAKRPVERSGIRGVAARKSSCRATAER